jgi:hypothetical protein
MAMSLFKNTLVINVPNSEASINGQLIGIKDREVSGYYTNDDPSKYAEIKLFFEDFMYDFFVDSKKMAVYFKDYYKKVLKYKSNFKTNLKDFDANFIHYETSDKKIKKLFYGGESNRYIKFDVLDKLTKNFKDLILGEITQIVIEKLSDRFSIYLKFVDNFEHLLAGKPTNQILEKNHEIIYPDLIIGYNKIFYGNPGSGKSYKIQQIIKNSLAVRTVFHPDYSNSDFVGQILPKLSGGSVTYIFKPGPFALALKQAFSDLSKNAYLVIEELNRGNASSIFGEVFQLLDRNELGSSEYKIKNSDLEEYLSSWGVYLDNIYIPSNLIILATMNTSDQNVYSIDSAFKRRWEMEKIRNDYSSKFEISNLYVPGTNVHWIDFLKTINKKIASANLDSTNTEDKQLGIFFASKKELSEKPNESNSMSAKLFSEKVLQYIWEDVAKYNRDEWFIEGILTLDDLIDKFNEIKLRVFNFYD